MNGGVYGNLGHRGNQVIDDPSAKLEGVYSVSKVI